MANLRSQSLPRRKLHTVLAPMVAGWFHCEFTMKMRLLERAHILWPRLVAWDSSWQELFLRFHTDAVQLHVRPTWALTPRRANGHSCVAASLQVCAQDCIEITFACLCRDMPSHLSACMPLQTLRCHERLSFLRLARDRSFIHGCKFHWCSSH